MKQYALTALLLLSFSAPMAAEMDIDFSQLLPKKPVYTAEQAAQDAAKSCGELYEEIRLLYGQSYNSGQTYWENPVNQTLAIAGTIITPAYYGLIYTRALDAREGYTQSNNRERLNQLRYHAARLRCFSG